MSGKIKISTIVQAFFAIVVAGVITFIFVSKDAEEMIAGEARLRSGENVATMQTNAATTTPGNGHPTVFLVTGQASSTLEFESENFETMVVSLQRIATSSVRTPIALNVFGSPNGIDFYPYDNTTFPTGALTALIHASTSPVHTWLPEENTDEKSTSTIMYEVTLIPAKKTRFVFTLATTTAGKATTTDDVVGFYAEVTGKITRN